MSAAYVVRHILNISLVINNLSQNNPEKRIQAVLLLVCKIFGFLLSHQSCILVFAKLVSGIDRAQLTPFEKIGNWKRNNFSNITK